MTEQQGGTEVSHRDTVWDRTRRQVREEIVTVALDLFLQHGFEQTTVDRIVAAAGISRRSFFRYFGTKEDIVLGDLADQGPAILDALRARPDDEPIWDALRHAFAVPTLRIGPERGLTTARLVTASPALRAAHLEKHLRWQDALAPEVERRLGDGDAPAGLRGRAIVATALACLDIATAAWLDHDGSGGIAELERLCDMALLAVRTDTGVGVTTEESRGG